MQDQDTSVNTEMSIQTHNWEVEHSTEHKPVCTPPATSQTNRILNQDGQLAQADFYRLPPKKNKQTKKKQKKTTTTKNPNQNKTTTPIHFKFAC